MCSKDKKRRHEERANKTKLSFAMDDEGIHCYPPMHTYAISHCCPFRPTTATHAEAEDGEQVRDGEDSAEEKLSKKRKKDPTIETSFLPDREVGVHPIGALAEI